MVVDYDESADVLYITLDEAVKNVIYEESGGAILRKGRSNGQVVGITIPMFTRRCTGLIAIGDLDIKDY
jgi:uncharacterized protein YuzE